MSHHFQSGLSHLACNQFGLAALKFRAAVNEQPNNGEAHAYLAQCLHELGDLPDALHEAEESVRLAPLHFRSHMIKAFVLVNLNRFPEAEASALEAVAHQPNDPLPFAILAQVRVCRNNLLGCLEAATRGLALYPDDPNCLRLRTFANLRLDRNADDEFKLDESFRHDLTDPLTHLMEASRLLNEGDFQQATEHFQTTLELNPASRAARAGLIESLTSHHWFYRWCTSFQRWIDKQSLQIWILLIPILLLSLSFFPPHIAGSAPLQKPMSFPVVILLAIYGLMTWIWMGSLLFNVLLLFHPLGRQGLTRSQIREACWFAFFLLLGVGSVLATLLFKPMTIPAESPEFWIIVGTGTTFTSIGSLFVISGWYRAKQGWGLYLKSIVFLGIWLFWVYMCDLSCSCCFHQQDPEVGTYRQLLYRCREVQVCLPIPAVFFGPFLLSLHNPRG